MDGIVGNKKLCFKDSYYKWQGKHKVFFYAYIKI